MVDLKSTEDEVRALQALVGRLRQRIAQLEVGLLYEKVHRLEAHVSELEAAKHVQRPNSNGRRR